MNKKLVILVTGSREIQDRDQAESLARSLLAKEAQMRGPENIHVIQGEAEGWDSLFRDVVRSWGWMTEEGWSADLFPTPLIRNHFMGDLAVSLATELGADVVCWSFAREWRSGTGHCARAARDKGILTIDYGVDTRRRDQK